MLTGEPKLTDLEIMMIESERESEIYETECGRENILLQVGI